GAASLVLATLAAVRPEPATAALLRGGFVAPTTVAPTTVAPTTVAPTSVAPTSVAPTSTTVPPPRRIMVLGDSTATMLAVGDPGAPFVLGSDTEIGCGLTPGQPAAGATPVGRDDCDGWWARWPASIATVRPSAVVVMFGPWDVLDHVEHGA